MCTNKKTVICCYLQLVTRQIKFVNERRGKFFIAQKKTPAVKLVSKTEITCSQLRKLKLDI